LAFPPEWAEGFGDEYYSSIKNDIINTNDEWHTNNPGTPFETNELNVTSPEKIRDNIDEILQEMRGNENG
jgi:hypothetical protein